MSQNQQLINKLIVSDDNIGRIKYIGELEGQPEIWYGIEWKDVTRGKHDGSYKGKKYFETSYPTSGSFVRPSKVEFGIDIWTAIEDKYFSSEKVGEKSNDKDEDKLLYNNFDVHKRAQNLKSISLSKSKIATLNDLQKLNQVFPNLAEIDLEANLFTSWMQIFQILTDLKNLQTINISNNSLELDEQILDKELYFNNIKTLILNRMNYDWTHISKIIKHFPKLNQLKVCFNNISQITTIDSSLIETLKIIDLESNPIGEWKNLIKLGELKELEILYANDIKISSISFDDCDHFSKTHYFPKLKSLALNHNLINDWHSVNELNKLKSLEELVFKFNPLNESDKQGTIRQMFFAKMEKLKLFNRSPLIREERKGAEIDYLKEFAKTWIELSAKLEKSTDDEEKKAVQNTLDQFYIEHPRYLALIKKLGPPDKSALDVKPDILKSSLLMLSIKNNESGEVLSRKIPASIEIKRLKVMICNLFKSSSFDVDSLQLFYISKKNPGFEYELDNDYRNLNFYAIENEDTLLAKSK